MTLRTILAGLKPTAGPSTTPPRPAPARTAAAPAASSTPGKAAATANTPPPGITTAAPPPGGIGGTLDTISALASMPAPLAPIPGAYEFKMVFTIYIDGQLVFSTRSPAFAWAGWHWIKLSAARASTPMKTVIPRLYGMAETDVAKEVDAAAVDIAAALRAPHQMLDGLGIPSGWRGDGLEFTIIGGTNDQWRFTTGNWREALLVGLECTAAKVPVDIKVNWHGRRETFMKYGQTFAERYVDRQKIAEAEAEQAKAEQSRKTVVIEQANAQAKLASLTSKGAQLSGLAVALAK